MNESNVTNCSLNIEFVLYLQDLWQEMDKIDDLTKQA
jgi:hypothetical protein